MHAARFGADRILEPKSLLCSLGLFGGGGGGGGNQVPSAPDTSQVQAQREKEAQEAATKERVRRAQTGGGYSLLDQNRDNPYGGNSVLGNPSQTLGG